jgi:hypothetical protein
MGMYLPTSDTEYVPLKCYDFDNIFCASTARTSGDLMDKSKRTWLIVAVSALVTVAIGLTIAFVSGAGSGGDGDSASDAATEDETSDTQEPTEQKHYYIGTVLSFSLLADMTDAHGITLITVDGDTLKVNANFAEGSSEEEARANLSTGGGGSDSLRDYTFTLTDETTVTDNTGMGITKENLDQLETDYLLSDEVIIVTDDDGNVISIQIVDADDAASDGSATSSAAQTSDSSTELGPIVRWYAGIWCASPVNSDPDDYGGVIIDVSYEGDTMKIYGYLGEGDSAEAAWEAVPYGTDTSSMYQTYTFTLTDQSDIEQCTSSEDGTFRRVSKEELESGSIGITVACTIGVDENNNVVSMRGTD